MKRFLPVTPDASGPGTYDPPLPPEMRQISISAPNGISPIVEVFVFVYQNVCACVLLNVGFQKNNFKLAL